MNNNHIFTLDLKFMHTAGTIAAYLIPHRDGAILVETGPGSTIPALTQALENFGFSPQQISDVFLTHIHLDHAGAAGWLARQGATIHVHSIGAPHMLNPERLLSSAKRIYGDDMDNLWGEFLPVPESKLVAHEDNDEVEIHGVRIRALDTPGHAYHHMSYILLDTCFSGDIGGVRLAGMKHIRLPMPPPEFNLEIWRNSLQRLISEHLQGSFSRIAPTHFGIHSDTAWHLQSAKQALDEVERWIETTMHDDPTPEELNERFLAWTKQRSINHGASEEDLFLFETANPSSMSSYGIYRYWHKVRMADKN